MKTSHEDTIDPELERMLREIRPEADPAFLAELDKRAAAGFAGARDARGAKKASAWERLAEGFRRTPPRLILTRVGAGALACIVLATAVVATQGLEGSDEDAEMAHSLESGGAAGAPEPAMQRNQVGTPRVNTAQIEAFARSATNRGRELSGGATYSSTADLADEAVRLSGAPTGPFAADRDRRAIERSANLTLGTDPESVRGATEEIFGIVGRYDGIVLSSSIQDGPEGEAGARFDLMIPSDRLSGALADLSAVAEVRSREESTVDITAPTVTVGERLQDARAEIEGLLDQLAAADTDGERFAAKQQLGFQRRRVASLRATLSRLERRANLSRVSLQVVTGDEATFPGGGEDDSWTIGDAVDDAGRILSTAAGVTLVALAVLAPFALLALLGWLARRAWVRQGRERALET